MFKFFKKPLRNTASQADLEPTPQNEGDSERFEREKMNRRAALRKMGIMTGAAVATLISADDLARLAASKLKEQEATKALGETLARDFRSAGVAVAETFNPTAPAFPVDCQDRCDQELLKLLIKHLLSNVDLNNVTPGINKCMRDNPKGKAGDCYLEVFHDKVPTHIWIKVKRYLECCYGFCVARKEGKDMQACKNIMA